MTPAGIAEAFELLFDKDNRAAYQALQTLQAESEQTNRVYAYWDRLAEMLSSEHSYLRTRALVLLAYNAKWDTAHKTDKILNQFLAHITDAKPITARQCIKLLPVLAGYKPECKDAILLALSKADISVYDDTMGPLLYQDIKRAKSALQKV